MAIIKGRLCLVKLMINTALMLIVSPFMVFNLPYKTVNNFTNSVLYPECAKAYARPEVTRALCAVAQELYEKHGYKLLVWDTYRPHSVQFKMWDLVPDERYVGDPKKGSHHNRGLAVDVSLAYPDGTACEMATDFDDFSPAAHRGDRSKLPEAIRKRMDLLDEVMFKHGFKGISTEWWHFYFESDDRTLYNITFEELEILQS